MSDCFALESQKKAQAAIDGGRFTREIAPVTLTLKGVETTVDRDEHPRGDTTGASLRKLPPVFPLRADGASAGRVGDGVITAGSSSGITDGGAAVVLASEE